MEISWSNCYSHERIGSDKQGTGGRTEYEQDYDRLIFSSAFRRLQNKTQVFPLPGSVLVHNRLTHSLEVASVGRSLGKLVGGFLCGEGVIASKPDTAYFYEHNLKNVIAAACLAHDLGNPAFGHSGEEAIQQFFVHNDSSSIEDRPLRSYFSPNEWADLVNFEGNANTIRLLTRQLRGRLKGGNFKLTNSTLVSTIKYPCESIASAPNSGKLSRKKFGFFQSEKAVVDQIMRSCHIVKSSGSPVAFERHPFVYLVEAADDICYNIIDLEDAQRLHIIPHKVAKELLMNIVLSDPNTDETRFLHNVHQLENDPNEQISYLRAKSINTLTMACSRVFMEHKESILKGSLNEGLIDCIHNSKVVLSELKKISIEDIYNNKQVVELEIAGYEVLGGLLDDFVPAIMKSSPTAREKKIISLIPDQFFPKSEETAYEKVMSVLDFISGMTDLYALDLYRQLRGITVKGIN